MTSQISMSLKIDQAYKIGLLIEKVEDIVDHQTDLFLEGRPALRAFSEIAPHKSPALREQAVSHLILAWIIVIDRAKRDTCLSRYVAHRGAIYAFLRKEAHRRILDATARCVTGAFEADKLALQSFSSYRADFGA